MIKVIGMICLVSGFCGLAFDKIRMEKEQIKNLMEIRDFVCYLKGEIDYSHIPIPDICHEYSDRTEGKIRIFLKNLCKNIDLFVGVDSSFMHFANCAKVKSIGIFGQLENFIDYNPYSGCYGKEEKIVFVRPYNRSLNAREVEIKQVIHEFQKFISK